MALFRFHRSGLHESLQTTIIVKTFNEMVEAILMSFDDGMLKKADWGAEFKIIPYPEKDLNFDPRIGWYTHMVLTNILEKDNMHPVGFLSEPFDK